MSSRAFLLTLIVPACVLLAAVVDSARRAVGMPFPSVLVAADGGFVTFFLPGWGTTNLPIRHGDPVLAVDGVAVAPQPGELPGRAVYRLVADARRAGRHAVVCARRLRCHWGVGFTSADPVSVRHDLALSGCDGSRLGRAARSHCFGRR